MKNVTVLVLRRAAGKGFRDPRPELERSATTGFERAVLGGTHVSPGEESRDPCVFGLDSATAASAHRSPVGRAAGRSGSPSRSGRVDWRPTLSTPTQGPRSHRSGSAAYPIPADGTQTKPSRRTASFAQSKADGTYLIDGTDNGAYEVDASELMGIRAPRALMPGMSGRKGWWSARLPRWSRFFAQPQSGVLADGSSMTQQGSRSPGSEPRISWRGPVSSRSSLQHEFGPPRFVGGHFEVFDTYSGTPSSRPPLDTQVE